MWEERTEKRHERDKKLLVWRQKFSYFYVFGLDLSEWDGAPDWVVDVSEWGGFRWSRKVTPSLRRCLLGLDSRRDRVRWEKVRGKRRSPLERRRVWEQRTEKRREFRSAGVPGSPVDGVPVPSVDLVPLKKRRLRRSARRMWNSIHRGFSCHFCYSRTHVSNVCPKELDRLLVLHGKERSSDTEGDGPPVRRVRSQKPPEDSGGENCCDDGSFTAGSFTPLTWEDMRGLGYPQKDWMKEKKKADNREKSRLAMAKKRANRTNEVSFSIFHLIRNNTYTYINPHTRRNKPSMKSTLLRGQVWMIRFPN